MFESNVFNDDNLIGMKLYPDNFFDLAVADPPYGIGIHKSSRLVKEKGLQIKKWDNNTPSDEYFNELFRISKNQIIWGGNYFKLRPSKHYLVWDKMQPETMSFAGCEYAWGSFNQGSKVFRLRPMGHGKRIHPTQKPVQLYEWIYKLYTKPGDKIIDTHMGSQSSRIAAWKMGLHYWGYEIDPDYFTDGKVRFLKETGPL
jgi:site-specific DNA-methyltransferase (adenine-specific)